MKPLSFEEPALTIDKSADYTMKLDTTCGGIDLNLSAAKAPHTVNSFNFLVNKGYLDHTKCHRLTAGGIFVLQCGDPKGTGEGGPGYSIPDENLKDKNLKGNVYPAGTVAMANRYDAQKKGRNTGGSQFFLVYQDGRLPPDYTPFGTISDSGMKVLKKIAKAGESTGQGDGAERDRRHRQGDRVRNPDPHQPNFGRAGCGQPPRRSPMLAVTKLWTMPGGNAAPRRHHVEEAL